MKRTITPILGLAGLLTLSACGENTTSDTAQPAAVQSDQRTVRMMEVPAQPEAPQVPQVLLTGEFELNGPAPFAMQVSDTVLQCQSASPGSPFRAHWSDVDSGMNVLVTGWPSQDGGLDHRVDLFQVIQWTPAEQKTSTEQNEARLSGATLKVEEVSRTGRSAIYSVHATGTFEEGGTFTASGHCRA